MRFLYGVFLLTSFHLSLCQSDSLKKCFDSFDVQGSIVISDLSEEVLIYHDSLRCAKEFTPASTFKIFNSLVALETKIIPDETYVISWDSVDRGYPKWNQDHNLRSAFKYSAVWFYQELARNIGRDKMQYYIDLNGYGNKNINDSIDDFWLRGQLRITSNQQIELLKKLYKNELRFSLNVQETVKDIMLIESNNEYKLFGKTGWGFQDDLNIGWFVGWITTSENTYFFATNIETSNPNKDFARSRKRITLDIFKSLEFIQ